MSNSDRAAIVKRIDAALYIYGQVERDFDDLVQIAAAGGLKRIPDKLKLLRSQHQENCIRLRVACTDLAALCPDPDPPALTDEERAAMAQDFALDHQAISSEEGLAMLNECEATRGFRNQICDGRR